MDMNTRMHSPNRAPWWAYTIPIAVVNYGRQLLVPPDDAGDAVSIGLFVATSAAVVVIVTALHRIRRAMGGTR